MQKTLVMPAIMSTMGVLGLTYQLTPAIYLHIAHSLHFVAATCFCAAA